METITSIRYLTEKMAREEEIRAYEDGWDEEAYQEEYIEMMIEMAE